jgi:hypothetical protein
MPIYLCRELGDRLFEGGEFASSGTLDCPNCGAARFFRSDRGSQICDHCGTEPETTGSGSGFALFPACHSTNEMVARCCRECGLALDMRRPDQTKRLDLAAISIAATVIGSMFVPVVGPILGLFLAHKARDQARATGKVSGSAELARIAIPVGWVGLGVTLVAMCLVPFFMRGQIAVSICSGMHPLSLPASGL